MFADSVRDPDLFFATGISVVDPFIYVETDGQRVIVTSEIEADAARRNSRATDVLLDSKFGCPRADRGRDGVGRRPARGAPPGRRRPRPDEVVVPPSFPVAAADSPPRKGRRGHARPQAVRAPPAGQGRARARRASAPHNGPPRPRWPASSRFSARRPRRATGLVFEGEELTAERVRAEVIATLRAHGCEGEPPITSPGPQGAFVHELGTGPVRPGESLIVDIFPRTPRAGSAPT